MRSDINNLHQIANQKSRRILGLMSGTSLDGLDMAIVHITGHGTRTKVQIEQYGTRPFSSRYKPYLKQIFARRQVDLELLTCLHAWIATQHVNIIKETLDEWHIELNTIDIIASHGQTVYHAPKRQHPDSEFHNATLQLGDGDHLAHQLGRITVSDFRQKHIAAQGEGAPLAPYGDYLLFQHAQENRILLNIGGIANLTFLPAGQDFSQAICTDIGPGNGLMDAWARHAYGQAYDHDGTIASSGVVHQELLARLLAHPFFLMPAPKTTGPEVFNMTFLQNTLADFHGISAADVMTTLAHFTQRAIQHVVTQLPIVDNKDTVIYASGGGVYNQYLMTLIQNTHPDYTCHTTQSLGIPPDAKEAVLFALLANECIAGDLPVHTPPQYPKIHLGKISLPR